MSDAAVALSQELRFHRMMARAGTFVDIGAHKGEFVLGMNDIAGIRAVAIEPLPYAFEILRERAAACPNPIRTINVALSDREGVAKLDAPILADGGVVWEWASIIKDFTLLKAKFPEIVEVRSIEVKLTQLDTLGLDCIRAIKLDAEGAEYEILRGGREVLANMRPVVSVELEERHRVGCTYAVPAFMDAMKYACFFQIDEQFLPYDKFDRALMQRGSPNPASHDYSRPYVNCFYFIPLEDVNLLDKMASKL